MAVDDFIWLYESRILSAHGDCWLLRNYWFYDIMYVYMYIYVFIPGHSNYIEQLLSRKHLRYCFAWSSCPSSDSTSLALEDPFFPQSRNWFTGKIRITTSIILYWVKPCFPVHPTQACFLEIFPPLLLSCLCRTRDGSKPGQFHWILPMWRTSTSSKTMEIASILKLKWLRSPDTPCPVPCALWVWQLRDRHRF